MNVPDIITDKSLHDFVRTIVNDKQFLRLKDAFVSHVPSGEEQSLKGDLAAIQVAHGKVLGTRYVFNMLEDISRKAPADQRRTFNRVDKDLNPD